MIRLSLFGLLLILAGCGTNPGIASPSASRTVVPMQQTSAVPVSPAPASDFAFVFRFGLCSMSELDTFSGQYTRGAIGTEPAITIPVSLTRDELAQINQKMVEIDYFNYPTQFMIMVPSGVQVAGVTPAYRYEFKVQSNGVTKEVFWKDNIVQPTSTDADQLRELAQLIRAIIRAKPAVQMLPRSMIGCL